MVASYICHLHKTIIHWARHNYLLVAKQNTIWFPTTSAALNNEITKKLMGTGHNGRNKQYSFLGKIIWKFEMNLETFIVKQCFSRIIQVPVVTLLIGNGLPETSSSVNDHKTSLEREFQRRYIFYFHFFFQEEILKFPRSQWVFPWGSKDFLTAIFSKVFHWSPYLFFL